MNKLIQVDPALTRDDEVLDDKLRQEAKEFIKKASAMLELSNGQLEPQMWEKLFLSIDLPANVNRRGEARFTAIPSEVVQHFRAATGMESLGCRAGEAPPGSTGGGTCVGFSSKVVALVNDIPRHERSVVVASSRHGVAHLSHCFGVQSIGHRSLFVGQNPTKSETAVQEWKNSKTDGDGDLECPVLLIQAGAAASGLTLTDSCKIFLLEPLLSWEEERQVYARCHRYGQTRSVEVKCYYTPVSVESRLLEWRRRSTANKQPGENVLYKRISPGNEKEEESEDETEMDSDQTLFLLGL